MLIHAPSIGKKLHYIMVGVTGVRLGEKKEDIR